MEVALAAYWLAAVLVFAAAVVPSCARLVPRFPARGAALAPGVAFAALALTGYWVGQVAWSSRIALACVTLVAVLGILAGRNADLPDWRQAVPPLAVFLAAFLLFVAVRAVDPAAHAVGGEKFLDYGLMKSIVLAESLPPEDIWFAGRPVRYYYGGLLSVTAFADGIGVPVRYAYNLGLATCYAALATGAYGVGSAIAANRSRAPGFAGVVAAAFVCLAGFPAAPVRLLAGLLPADTVAAQAEFLFAAIRLENPQHLATDLRAWDYWIARYVVPSTITVTPMWSYLNADLHAHVIAPVFLVPGVGAAFAAWRARSRRRALGLLAALAGFAGALAITSTWSLPTAAGLAALAVSLADRHPASLLPARVRAYVPTAGASGELARYLLGGIAGAAVGLAGVALAAPFFLLRAPENSGVGFLPPGSPLLPFLLVWGAFTVLFAAHLARDLDWSARRLAAVVAGSAVAVGAGLLVGQASTALLAVLLAAGWYARRTDRSGFVAVLVVAGAGILLVAELAYAKVWPHDPNAPRWNTVYKLSMQVAVLWGIAAGVAAAARLEPLLARLTGVADRVSRADAAAAAVAVLVLASAMTFPALALADHFGGAPREPREGTLDATAFVEVYHPAEADAFEWLRANADGQPTVLTSVGTPIYGWVNAPSVFTGYPTVAGWTHEKGYRGRGPFNDRAADVRLIFDGTQRTQALLLDKYDVDYVYYGPVEQERYPDAEFGGPGVERVYRNTDVVIYRVNADAACAAAGLDCHGD
jgi:YYY domain-containing protein